MPSNLRLSIPCLEIVCHYDIGTLQAAQEKNGTVLVELYEMIAKDFAKFDKNKDGQISFLGTFLLWCYRAMFTYHLLFGLAIITYFM